MSSKKFKGSRFRYQVYQRGGFSHLKRTFETYKQLDFIIKRDTSPEDFLGYLFENYPDIYKSIDWIKFFPRYRRPFKVNGQKKEIEFRITLLYVEPDPEIREKAFREKLKITNETGRRRG